MFLGASWDSLTTQKRAMSTSNAAAEQYRARRRQRRIRMQRISADDSHSLPPPPPVIPSPPPLSGVKTVIGLRKRMEDAVSVRPNLCAPIINRHLPVHYFAVFDDHGGSYFSKIFKERMHQILLEELMGVPAPAPGESQIEPPRFTTKESALHVAWSLLCRTLSLCGPTLLTDDSSIMVQICTVIILNWCKFRANQIKCCANFVQK